MYSNDEKTAVILIYDECNKNAYAVVCSFMQTINIFPKTFRFITISFNQANDIYVKIYETAVLFFLIKKQISTLTLEMYCVLHFRQFRF
jgi:hypothetical protein